MSNWQIGTVTCPLWKIPPHSASAADATTFHRVFHSIKIGPFCVCWERLGGGGGIDDR